MKKKLALLVMTIAVSAMTICGCVGNESKERDRDRDRDSGKARLEMDYEDVELDELHPTMEEEDINMGIADFSVNMLQTNLHKGENTLVSPISIMYALDLLAAGGEGQTQEEILNAICPGATMDDLLSYAQEYKERLVTDEDVLFHIANSIWANESIVGDVLNPTYMATAQQRLDAMGCVLPFNNEAADLINDWVKDSTEGMIPKIIDEMPSQAALFLINAIAFDGKWDEEYLDSQIREEGVFYNGVGEEETARMLSSTEATYLCSEDAQGFVKYYRGRNFAFVAILPNDESISIEDYVAGLSGEEYMEFMNSATTKYDVHTLIPCFEYDYSETINAALQSVGIEKAFDEYGAEFKPIADLGDENLYVNKVLHVTHIELNENGTRAAAVTAITMEATCALPEEDLNRYVYLDRPFAYAIVDTETMLPIFFGTVNTVE